MRRATIWITFLLLAASLSSCYEFRLKIASKRFEKESIKEDLRLRESYSTAEIPSIFLTKESKDEIYLKTGWYYITDSLNGVAKHLDKSDSILYYIDKEPILTIDNFTRLAVYESDSETKYVGLYIFFDEEGTESWSLATEKSKNRNLALIVNECIDT